MGLIKKENVVNSKAAPPVNVKAAQPAAEKKTRAKRAPFHRDGKLSTGDTYTIDAVKAIVTVEGISFPVQKFSVVFGAGDARNVIRGTLKDIVAYIATLEPGKARRASSPYGTLSIVRIASAIEAIVAKRAPDLRDALIAALAGLNADLAWQEGIGVKVGEIRAAELARIANVKAAKAAKPATPETK